MFSRCIYSQDEDGSGAGDRDEDEANDPIATLEVLDAADEGDPKYLLYPPLALRTPRQKRIQMILLGEIILEVQMAFNQHVDQLHSAKGDCMDKARGKFSCGSAFQWCGKSSRRNR